MIVIFIERNSMKSKVIVILRLIVSLLVAALLLPNFVAIVHADDADECEISETAEIVTVSPAYDDLAEQLCELRSRAQERADSKQEEQQIIERQIVLLNSEIENAAIELAACIQEKYNMAAQLNARQTKLESEHEKNMKRIEILNQRLADTCTNVDTMMCKSDTLASQMSEIWKLTEMDKEVVAELDKVQSEKDAMQQKLSDIQDHFTALTTLLEMKRSEMYSCLLDQQNEINVRIGDLISVTERTFLSTNEDSNGVMWNQPCEYKQLSSPFGYRIHPVYKEWKMHNGVDLSNSIGTPIHASRSGVVVDSGYDDSSGYHVTIHHMDGYMSTYLHLNRPSELQIGDVIIIGDYIGEMGTTGVSTGPHLHFGICFYENWVNPMNYID